MRYIRQAAALQRRTHHRSGIKRKGPRRWDGGAVESADYLVSVPFVLGYVHYLLHHQHKSVDKVVPREVAEIKLSNQTIM